MNTELQVLVVGTTADYIEWIRQVSPGRALFLTDYEIRNQAAEQVPQPAEEVLSGLDDYAQARDDLLLHLRRWNITLNGIACFDCESLELAAWLAREFSLPYPTVESIRLCRDKYASKVLWQRNSVKCPQVRLVQSPEGVFDFLQKLNAPCVIKPLTGSGSELVFNCMSKKDCEKWATILQKELKERKSLRLYSDATAWFLAEEFITGDEYSCDFVVRDDAVEVIRLTKKIHARNKPFGTINGYALCCYPPEDFPAADLEHTLYGGAKALGISHAICMVDFLVRDNEIVLLEMTPRPGGDCIPHLLRRSGILDSLVTALDFAQQKPLSYTRGQVNGQYVGLRLHAKRPGEILKFDIEQLQGDPRIREINLIRKAGHLVAMPPHDYESWYLGYVIFEPVQGIALENQCHDLSRRLVVETA